MIEFKDLTEVERRELSKIPFSRQDKIDDFFDRVSKNNEIRYNGSSKRNREFNELLEKEIVSEKSDYEYKNGEWELME